MRIDLVKYPVFTKKSVLLKKNNKYTFDVNVKLNKLQIKKIIQNLFQVKCIGVNTHRLPRKKKVLAASTRSRYGYKRVIITIQSQDLNAKDT